MTTEYIEEDSLAWSLPTMSLNDAPFEAAESGDGRVDEVRRGRGDGERRCPLENPSPRRRRVTPL
jgi:hypothetical protein